MDFINRFQTQFREFWGQLEQKQQWALIGACAIVLVGLSSLVVWANQTDYAPLYTNLTPETASEMTKRLDSLQVDYRPTFGGTVIEVPRERVAELRLAMAGEGLLKQDAVGFELFDNPPVNTSSEGDRIRYQRALQGELQRTINEIDSIESSRVILVIPKTKLFTEDQKEATASVVIKVADNRNVRPHQITAISNMVAAAVEGMDPSNVNIVDTHGKMLSSPGDDFGGGLSSSLLEIQKKQERSIQEKVTTLLERVVGPGKVEVRVQSTLDLSSEEQVAEVFDPEAVAVRSSQTRTENREATVPGPVGVPGTESNLPSERQDTDIESNSVVKAEETINHEINKTTTRTNQMPGRLARLSVAVLVDGIYEKTAEGAKTYTPRTQEELKNLTDLVKGSVGYSADREDIIQVRNIQFHSLEAEMSEAQSSLQWQTPARYGLVLLGMILLFALLRPLILQLTERPLTQEAFELELREAEREAAELAEHDENALPNLDSHALLTAGNAEKQRREEVINLARSDMENTISTLREWLREPNQPNA